MVGIIGVLCVFFILLGLLITGMLGPIAIGLGVGFILTLIAAVYELLKK